MAPQQELEKLIPGEPKSKRQGQYGGYSTEEAVSSAEESSEIDAHVVIVQPTEDGGTDGNKDKHAKKGGKQGSRGPEEPRNCRQLETVLFFFGVAGMIVSLIMLLRVFVMKMIPYS